MKEEIIRKACRHLMNIADLVYVSTVDENGFPQTRAMANLYNKDQFERLSVFFNQHQDEFLIYLNTNRASVKMEQIKINPKTCLYYCSYKETHGLSLIGEIQVIEDKNIRHLLWQDDWIQFYEGGVDGTDYTILQFKPLTARGWYKCEKFEFQLN